MLQQTPFRFARGAITALAVLAMAGVAAAQNPAGMIYAQPGTLSAKIQLVGGVKGPVPFSTMEFGPRSGVPAGGFRLIMDDGSDSITLRGTYIFDGKKITLTPDPNSIESDLENLIEDLGGISVSVNCQVSGKAKVKAKDNVESAATNAKANCIASLVGSPDTIKVNLGFKGKGDEI